MGMQIEDGKGRGYISSVSESNRLNVSAKTNPRAFYVSRDNGLAFYLTSIDESAVAGDIVSYIKNTSATRNLYIKNIHYGSSQNAFWKLWSVSGTAGGTETSPVNLNLTSGKQAEALSYGNYEVSGLSLDGLIDSHRTLANSHDSTEWEDSLILGPNNAIAIEYDQGSTGSAEINIEFHYEDITRSN